jgi:hypothetical protein
MLLILLPSSGLDTAKTALAMGKLAMTTLGVCKKNI